MSWLSEYVRPKIRTLFAAREVPDNLWRQCPHCQQMIFHADLAKNLKVCPHCGFHMRATASERLAWTFDEDACTRIELPKVPADPLKFRDTKRYTDRLKEARDATGLDDAILVAHGRIEGHRAVVAAMAFEFMGGSMGAAVGEAIVTAARLAVLQDAPLDRVHGGGWREDAGGCHQPHADAAHGAGDPAREGGGAAVRGRADRPHDRRRDRQLSRCWATCRSPSRAR